MKCSYSVTFEFDQAAPETAKGVVEASGARTCAARALDAAKAALPKKTWQSLVLVLEREVDNATSPAPEVSNP